MCDVKLVFFTLRASGKFLKFHLIRYIGSDNESLLCVLGNLFGMLFAKGDILCSLESS